MQPFARGTCEWRNSPWRESSQTCSPQIGRGCAQPGSGDSPGVRGCGESRGCVPMAAGARCRLADPHWSYNQWCLVCLKSTCSPCDLCPPRSGGVLLKNRGHQSPCLAEWVPRKVRESRAGMGKILPSQCPPTPPPRKSTAHPEGPPPSSMARAPAPTMPLTSPPASG